MKFIINNYHFFLLILFFNACSEQDVIFETSVEEFIIKDGFEIEVIAAEPLLDSPVAMTFDEKGRIWAVELPGYMRDMEGSDEDKADGKIVILTDENGDGKMDNREIFMDSMVAPRTLLHVYGGLLYSNGTSLFWAKLNDTKITETVLVDSLYVVGGNIEHQPNGLLYNIDNWIYSAKSQVRYRLKNGKWLREPTSHRGQWGISHDKNGHLYYNTNSTGVLTDRTMPNQLLKNSYQKLQFGTQQNIAENKNLYAYQATAVNRGYQKGVLDSTGKVKEFTSACSPLVYTGNRFGKDFQESVFVCAPEANLVKRYILEDKEDLKIAIPAYENSDFLVSKMETFRPVNLYNAPDGSLYILDLRKGIIQHRAYMSSYLREKILDKGLDSIRGIGRIYRVIKTENKIDKANNFSNLNNDELVKMLATDLTYARNFAQQQLITRQAKSSKKAIEKIALNNKNPYGQLHALWTLEGLDALDKSLFTQLIAMKNEPIIHKTLIRFSSFFNNNEAEQIAYFQQLFTLNQPIINRQLAIRLGEMNTTKADELLLKLAKANKNNTIISEAIISGISGRENNFLEKLRPISTPDSLSNFLKKTIKNKEINKTQTPQLPKKTFQDNRTVGCTLYSLYCSSCHGLDGAGKSNLAPPLTNSEYVGGSKNRLIALVLNGMEGPITVNGTVYKIQTPMPGIKNNPNLSDKDIANLLTFVRNSFSLSDAWINEKDVAIERAKTKDRTQLFTAAELENYE